MRNHHITTKREERMDGGEWYRAYCSCGYRTGLDWLPQLARKPAEQHAQDARANTE